MTDPTRRGFLALGIGAATLGTGCIDDGGDGPAGRDGTASPADGGATDERASSGTVTDDTTSPGTQTTTPVPVSGIESLSFNHADKLRRVDASFPQRDVASYYLALVTSDDHAATFPVDRFGDDAARSFFEATDFSQAAVVVLQDRQSSSRPDFELLSTKRVGSTVTIETRYPGEAATADITTDTLLVRVPTDDQSLHAARATLSPQYRDPIRFSTANVYDSLPVFDPAGDLIVLNRDCTSASPSVTVTYGGDLFFRDGLAVQAASSRRVAALLAYPGEWTVAVRVDGETTTRTFSIDNGPPGDVLVDVAGDGTVSLSQQPSGVDDVTLDGCKTDGYPYESENPAENLDKPVDLWVLDHAADAHHLTVTISDGDSEVFTGEFDTGEGYDKARRAGLLAKKTTYTVDVSTDDGASVTETVTVSEGTSKLTVRVTESGELAVSLS